MTSLDATSWRNWAGNVSARPARVRMPGVAGGVAAGVTKAAADGLPMRMAGTGHSFTPAASTDGVLLSPAGLTAIRSVDTEAGLVTAEAGCPLYRLNEALYSRGLSLTNMCDIHVQTVDGATQTGTHDTGQVSGSIAAQVAWLEMMLVVGAIVTYYAYD